MTPSVFSITNLSDYKEGYELGKSKALKKEDKENPFKDNEDKRQGFEDGFFDNQFK